MARKQVHPVQEQESSSQLHDHCLQSIEVFSDGDVQCNEAIPESYPVWRWADGVQLWRETSHAAANTTSILEGAWFFPSSHNYNLTTRPDHLHATFTRRVKLFVLWHTRILKTPAWLSEGFIRTGAVLAIQWHHPAWLNLAMAMAGKKREMHSSGLRVWAAKGWLPAGETICLGGTEGSTFVDNNYILAWLPDSTIGCGDSSIKVLNMRMPSVVPETRAEMQRKVLQAVAHDDLASMKSYVEEEGLDVRTIFSEHDLRTGALALPQALAKPERAAVLLTSHAAAHHSLGCLSYLIYLGSKIDTTTLCYLIRQDVLLEQRRHQAAQAAAGPVPGGKSSSARASMPATFVDVGVEDEATCSEQLIKSSADAHQGIMKGSEDGCASGAAGGGLVDEHNDVWSQQRADTVSSCRSTHAAQDTPALETLLTGYVRTSRHPLAAAASISQALQGVAQETKSGRGPKLAMMGQRFHAVVLDLAGRSDRVAALKQQQQLGGGGSRAGQQGRQEAASGDKEAEQLLLSITLQDVINPGGESVAIEDASLLGIAFQMSDLELVSCPTVQHYLEQCWHGEDYLALTHDEKGAAGTNYYSNDLLAYMLYTGGFVGPSLMPAARLYSWVAHMVMLCPRQFFDSPRGRWCFKLMAEVLMLAAYHRILLEGPNENLGWSHYLLAACVLGTLADTAEQLVVDHSGHLSRFLGGWAGLDVVLCLMLLAAAILRASAGSFWSTSIPMLLMSQPTNDNQPPDNTADVEAAAQGAPWLPGTADQAQRMLFWAAALPLWGRMLAFLAPLHPEFGPLVNIVMHMLLECIIFCVPFTVVLLGASGALYGAVNSDPAAADMEDTTLPEIMLQLLQALVGVYDWSTLNQLSDRGNFLFAKTVLVLWTLFATVVLANLLIAVVTYKYKPDEMQALSKFQQARSVAMYQRMVHQHALPPPFNLLRLALFWMPSGCRSKANTKFWGMRAGQAPFDGLPLPGDQSRRFPTGRHELAYLVFLCTCYPLLLALVVGTLLAACPVLALHFAAFGATSFLQDVLERSDGPQLSLRLRLALFPLLLLGAFLGLIACCVLLVVLQSGVWSYLGKLVFHTWWFIVGAVRPTVPSSHATGGTVEGTCKPNVSLLFTKGEISEALAMAGFELQQGCSGHEAAHACSPAQALDAPCTGVQQGAADTAAILTSVKSLADRMQKLEGRIMQAMRGSGAD